MEALEQMRFVYHCEACGEGCVLDGNGGRIACVCEEPDPSAVRLLNLHDGGWLEKDRWYRMADLSTDISELGVA